MCTGIMIAMIAATAVSTYAAYESGQQQKAAGEYAAEQAQADANAERGAAQVMADKIRKAGEKARSDAQAALASSGASVDSISADAIDADIVSAYEEDALVSMYSGGNRARSREAEGQSARIAGRNAANNATMQAASTAAGGWYKAQSYQNDQTRRQVY